MQKETGEVLEIIKEGNPLLRQKSEEVKEITEKEKKLIKDMYATFKSVDGMGIAAVQVGVLKRIIVIECDNKVYTIINPKIISSSGKQRFFEACFSIGIDNEYVGGFTIRPHKMKVTGLDENGNKIEINAEDMLAVMLSHEIDHLDGVLFIDKLDGELMKFNSREERRNFRKQNPLKVMEEESMLADYKNMQNLNRETILYAKKIIKPGISVKEIRDLCEKFLLNNGADSFWYWNVGAFVFAGNETRKSVSGKAYEVSNINIQFNDIITIDLSPQFRNIWGDLARTIILENGKIVERIADIKNPFWKRGLETEEMLHSKLVEIVTPNMLFEELHYEMNKIIEENGFSNLDFMGNLGHSIVKDKSQRIYIEKGNKSSLSSVEMFTFEPHIGDSRYGYKKEDIYLFHDHKLVRL